MAEGSGYIKERGSNREEGRQKEKETDRDIIIVSQRQKISHKRGTESLDVFG